MYREASLNLWELWELFQQKCFPTVRLPLGIINFWNQS